MMDRISRRDILRLATSQFALANLYPSFLLSEEIEPNQDIALLIPEFPEYKTYSVPFNKRIKTTPGMIAVCQTEAGVQKAVKYAKYRRLPIAVKSGGHSFEGFSLNSKGLVIDVSHINQQELVGSQLISGAGTKLFQLYDFLLPKGRIVPVGSCGTVGLSGLTLGGGYGMFSRRWGLTCDNLTGVRMVDGKGRIIDSKDDPDLLWACRGGGNGNFGIITELRYQTHPAPDSLPRHRIKFRRLSSHKAVTLCKRWFELAEKLPDDAFSAFVLNGNNLTILITYFDEKSKDIVRTIVNGMSRDATSVSPFAQEKISKAVTRYYGRKTPLHFKNASAGYYKGFDDLKNGIHEVFDLVMSSRGTLFQINTLGGAIADKSKIRTAAYPHRMFGYLGELQSYWENDAATGKVLIDYQTGRHVGRCFVQGGILFIISRRDLGPSTLRLEKSNGNPKKHPITVRPHGVRGSSSFQGTEGRRQSSAWMRPPARSSGPDQTPASGEDPFCTSRACWSFQTAQASSDIRPKMERRSGRLGTRKSRSRPTSANPCFSSTACCGHRRNPAVYGPLWISTPAKNRSA
jgi:hypothetical protein